MDLDINSLYQDSLGSYPLESKKQAVALPPTLQKYTIMNTIRYLRSFNGECVSQPIPESGYPKKNRTYGASTSSVHTAYIYKHIQLFHEGGYPKNDCTRFPSQAYTVKFPSTPILAELTLKRSPKELRLIDTTS